MTNDSQMQTILELIAEIELGIDTLETRNRDSLDFHNVSVWDLKRALKNAYINGQHSIPRAD